MRSIFRTCGVDKISAITALRKKHIMTSFNLARLSRASAEFGRTIQKS